jgi:hypothetical protein
MDPGLFCESVFKAGLFQEILSSGIKPLSCVQPDEAGDMKLSLIASRLGSAMMILTMWAES